MEQLPVTMVKRGEVLLSTGEASRYSYYVKKGLLRSYTLDEKGKEHVYMFAPEGWIVGDIAAHAYNRPAQLNIVANEDSEIVKMPAPTIGDDESLSEIMDEAQALKEMIKLARRIAALQDRVITLLSASAAQRYEKFLELYPEISHRVPLKQIASFLGMTPEALSKVRRERVEHRS